MRIPKSTLTLTTACLLSALLISCQSTSPSLSGTKSAAGSTSTVRAANPSSSHQSSTATSDDSGSAANQRSTGQDTGTNQAVKDPSSQGQTSQGQSTQDQSPAKQSAQQPANPDPSASEPNTTKNSDKHADSISYKAMTRASWFTFKRSSGSSAALPLYAIKGTYGVDDSSNPTPAVPSAPLPSLYFNLPASQSQQLAAYWMTMSGNRNGVILVGPKGWKATDATEGANGSFGITLVNPGHPGEQIKLSDSGGCQGCAIQSIGRYFPNLTQWANDSGFPAEFNNAITFHRSLSDNLMAYALKPDSTGLATNGVAYQEHAGGSAAFETETVSLPASSHALATTILNYFVQVHKINRGPVLSYAPHGSYFRTISTPLGTIWSPDPDMNWHSGGMRPYPTKDTAVYLSAPNQTSLDTSTAKQLFTIPAVAGIDAQKQDMYHYLGLLKTTGHWLVYSTYTSEPEMNQPFGNDLWMYDLKTGKSAKITSFLDAGGAFFNLALYKHEVFYQKGGFDAKGKKLAKTSVYDMSNGTTSLIPANEVNNLTVHAEVDGQSMQVRLQEE